MDLPSHLFFGVAVGLVFFGRADVALVIGLGALIPDLDREYWYVPVRRYAEEQNHRALFHNVLVIAAAFVVSPFLSLGVFLHVLQDSFTTVKDRGVEWFYPFTRLVRRGVYDENGVRQTPDPKEHVYLYQEDPPGLVKLADPDLQERADRPVPWRRVYGFAQNSHLLDRGFLIGSIVIAAIWVIDPANSAKVGAFFPQFYSMWGVFLGYLGVGLLFASGETQSSEERARIKTGQPSRTVSTSRLRALKPAQVPLLLAGLVLLAAPIPAYWGTVAANVRSVFADPVLLLACAGAVVVVGAFLVMWETRGGRSTVV